MVELIEMIVEHARGMWRYRWHAILSVWVFALIGWAYVYAMPDTYEASAKVYVDTESTAKVVFGGMATQTDVMSEVSLMTRMILSRPNVEDVARETDLDLRARTPEDFQALVEDLQRHIRVAGTGDDIYMIQFEDTSRDTAEAVVQSLLNTFMEDSLGLSKEEDQQAEQALRDEIEGYEERLILAEEELKRFKQDNVGILPGGGGDYYQSLQAALSSAEETREKLRLAQERRRELERQLEGEEPVFGIMPSSELDARRTSVDAKIREYEVQLRELEVEFTDKHPDIQRIQDILDELRAKRAEELAAMGPQGLGAGPTTTMDMNPVYQAMKIELSRTSVEIATLRAELTTQENQVTSLQQRVNQIAEVEAQLARLNRDYEVVKRRYEQALERWEEFQTAQRLKEGTDQVLFRLIEPPFAPTEPSGPNRPLFLAFILVAAIGAGLSLAFGLNQINPVFETRQALKEVTGFPVLGSVSLVLGESDLARQRVSNLSLGATFVLFLGVFVGVLLFADHGSRMLRAIIGSAT